MTSLAAIVLPPLELDDVDLVTLDLTDDFGGHRRAIEIGRADLRRIITFTLESQHTVKGDRAALSRLILTQVHIEDGTGGEFDLGSTVFDDGVHGRTPARETPLSGRESRSVAGFSPPAKPTGVQGCPRSPHMQDTHRIETLERTVRRQGRWILLLGGLLAFSALAAATQAIPNAPMKVTIDNPVKVILEDIGYQIRSNHPIPVKQK